MSITPEDIQSQQFHVRFRGFDVDEVDTFLERVAESFLALQEENRELRDRLAGMEQRMEDFKAEEKTFHHAIISTQKIADEIAEQSRQKADELLAEAREEAGQIRNDAGAEIVDLEQKLEQLTRTRQQVNDELRSYLQGYLDQLAADEVPDSSNPVLPFARSEEVEVKEEEPLAAAAEVEVAEEEEPLAVAAEVEAVEEEDSPDLGEELYEKIELPADIDLDLDGDMNFTLDDPLDMEAEPAVVVDDRKKETGLKG